MLVRTPIGRAARPGRQPRPVHPARLALPGPPHPRTGHLARPARPPDRTDHLVRAAPSADRRGGGAGGLRLVACGLGRRGEPGRDRLNRSGGAAAGLAALVRPAGERPGAGPVAVVVLPAPLAAGPDHRRTGPQVPGTARRSRPRPGAGDRLHRPGDGPAGLRPVPGRLRRQGRPSRPRVRRASVPGPLGPAGHGGAGAGAPRRAGRPDTRPADPRDARICGRCRWAGARTGPVHDPAARNAPADRGRDRRRQRLLRVGPGPGAAAADGRRAGPRLGV